METHLMPGLDFESLSSKFIFKIHDFMPCQFLMLLCKETLKAKAAVMVNVIRFNYDLT